MPGLYDEDDEPVTGRRPREPVRSELSELIDMLGRRIGGAILVAGVAIGLGVYAGGDEVEAQKYQAFATDGEVFRVNTESGTIIACNASRCMQILERGQDLAEDQGSTLFKTPVAQVPAPAAAPQATTPALPAPAEPAPSK